MDTSHKHRFILSGKSFGMDEACEKKKVEPGTSAVQGMGFEMDNWKKIRSTLERARDF